MHHLVNCWKPCCTNIKWFKCFIKVDRLAYDLLISRWAWNIHLVTEKKNQLARTDAELNTQSH